MRRICRRCESSTSSDPLRRMIFCWDEAGDGREPCLTTIAQGDRIDERLSHHLEESQCQPGLDSPGGRRTVTQRKKGEQVGTGRRDLHHGSRKQDLSSSKNSTFHEGRWMSLTSILFLARSRPPKARTDRTRAGSAVVGDHNYTMTPLPLFYNPSRPKYRFKILPSAGALFGEGCFLSLYGRKSSQERAILIKS